MSRFGFVPPYLLQQVAEATSSGLLPEASLRDTCRTTLELDAAFRRARESRPRPQAAPDGTDTPDATPVELTWTVHTADNTRRLPGAPVRDETATEPSGDAAVDEAWDGVRASLAMFAEVYGRNSYDDVGARVSSTVHYGRNYQNAFWDGTQLVFGDGDGRIFNRLTIAVDILGHELVHAVTERTAGLVYRNQPGALNESISDVFGSCLKQRILGETAAEGDWLIGEGLFTEAVQGVALRSLSAPGTAYDDPVLGTDPQPGHMDDYVDTREDNGGVHINSGIPNRAFYLAATGIGGSSAEGAGRIWYDALLAIGPTTDFAGFAAATVRLAGEHAGVVRSAWESVGVPVSDDGAGAPAGDCAQVPGSPQPGDDDTDPSGEPAPSSDMNTGTGVDEGRTGERIGMLRVRRSGGVGGLNLSSELDLDGDDPRVGEARTLFHRIDLTVLARESGAEGGRVDAYSYVIVCGGHEVTVPEERATPDVLRLAELVLERPN